jgi:glutaryl-CoA dehydrogenase
MKAFQGTDFFNIDDELTVEQKLLRDNVREFVEQEFMPLIQSHYREAKFPIEIVEKLAELGILGANLDGYGCPGLDNISYGLINQELERGDSALRSFLSVQSSLVMFPIFKFGSEDQKERWLPRLATGKAIGCFGLTEADYGSNPASMQTRAELTGDGWLINGSKMWITNGSIAEIAIIWAQTRDGIRGFIVERAAPGYSARSITGKLSLRASDTAEIVLDDCLVAEDNILPDSSGLKSALDCLTQARYGIAWGSIGSAMACYEEALYYAKDRVQFSQQPIAAHQLIQQKLVEMVTEITKAQLLNYQLGRLKDLKRATHVQISMAKRNNVEQALNIARSARQILGANGITDDYQSMRHLCNLESVITYEGTHDIHTLIIGEHITGIPAYY